MSSKATIYNLAASALLLEKQIIDVDTDKSNEVRVFNAHWDIAFQSCLQDLDLDSTVKEIQLELLATLEDSAWTYVYKYPSDCIFFRRLISGEVTDTERTHIDKKTGLYNGFKAIYTNQEDAVAECVHKSISLTSLSPMTVMSIAYKLAMLSAPLITGKGAKKLRDDLKEMYIIAKMEAQETDSRENFVYEREDQRSTFVAARLE